MAAYEYNYSTWELIEATQIAYYDIKQQWINEYLVLNGSIPTLQELFQHHGEVILTQINERFFEKPSGEPKTELTDLEQYRLGATLERYNRILNGGDCSDWKIVHVQDENTGNGFFGCLIETSDSSAIIGFRGSESLDPKKMYDDWIAADCALLNSKLMPQQESATQYMNYIADTYEYDNYALTGHSLGGNLATSAYITCEDEIADHITQVVSIDGPGFSSDYIDSHAEAIAERSIFDSGNSPMIHMKYSWCGYILNQFAGIKDYEIGLIDPVTDVPGSDEGWFFQKHDTCFLDVEKPDSSAPVIGDEISWTGGVSAWSHSWLSAWINCIDADMDEIRQIEDAVTNYINANIFSGISYSAIIDIAITEACSLGHEVPDYVRNFSDRLGDNVIFTFPGNVDIANGIDVSGYTSNQMKGCKIHTEDRTIENLITEFTVMTDNERVFSPLLSSIIQSGQFESYFKGIMSLSTEEKNELIEEQNELIKEMTPFAIITAIAAVYNAPTLMNAAIIAYVSAYVKNYTIEEIIPSVISNVISLVDWYGSLTEPEQSIANVCIGLVVARNNPFLGGAIVGNEVADYVEDVVILSIISTTTSLIDWYNTLSESEQSLANVCIGLVAMPYNTIVGGMLIGSEVAEYVNDVVIPMFTEMFANIGDTLSGAYNITSETLENISQIWLHASALRRVDPLVFDLGNDGFDITALMNGTNFDLSGDGFAETINWTTSDAFLALDINANGSIDSGRELFGDQTLLSNGATAAHGFAALSQYDTNQDGYIDSNDEVFSLLRLWVDANGNGTSEEGELKSLSDLGIVAVNLSYVTTDLGSDPNGEAILGDHSQFVYADGSFGLTAELWVSTNMMNSIDTTVIGIPEDVQALPNVRSFGVIRSLHNAMALDESGALKSLLNGFVSAADYTARSEILQNILFFISGANDVASDSRGANMDARELAVVEAFKGEHFSGMNGPNPNTSAVPFLNEIYETIYDIYYFELMKFSLSEYLGLILPQKDEDGNVTLDLSLMNAILDFQLKNGYVSNQILKDISGQLSFYDKLVYNDESYTLFYDFKTYFSNMSAEYLDLIDSGNITSYAGTSSDDRISGSFENDLVLGNSGNDTLNGGDGNDILDGGTGNDVMSGNAGNDVYIFGQGSGLDTIIDNEGATTIRFLEGITLDDILITRTGNAATIRIRNAADVLTIDNYALSADYQNITLELSNGAVIAPTAANNPFNTMTGTEGVDSISCLLNNSNMYGLGGDDTLSGGDGNDLLNGGAGNDVMNGAFGNDTYVVNIGDGNDTIIDCAANGGSPSDTLIVGTDYSSLVFSRSNNDLSILLAGTGETVSISKWYASTDYTIESIQAGGYELSCLQVENLIQSMATFQASTGLSWVDATQQNPEGVSGIASQIWVVNEPVV